MSFNSLPRPYREFSSTVENVRSGVVTSNFLGGGSESQVFEIVVDGQKYALKFAHRFTPLDRPRNIERATQRKIDAGLRGLRVNGLEQIQSASTDEGVAIYDLIEGVTVCSMSDEELAKITRKQVQAFVRTVETAASLGIEFDPWNQDGTNVMYLPEDGLVLIDYFVDYANTPPLESRKNGIKALGSTALGLLTEKYNDLLGGI